MMYEGDHICVERRGIAVRRVKEVEPSPLIESYLRLRLPPAPDSPMKDPSLIYARGSRTFLVDDVGMLHKGVLELDGYQDVHIAFWDRILVGRERLCRSMAELVASEAGRAGVWTAIPDDARATVAFAKRVGFVEYSKAETIVVLVCLVT